MMTTEPLSSASISTANYGNVSTGEYTDGTVYYNQHINQQWYTVPEYYTMPTPPLPQMPQYGGGSWTITAPQTSPFSHHGVCKYCEEESDENMQLLLGVFICPECFMKALDAILAPNLNKNVIKAIKDAVN